MMMTPKKKRKKNNTNLILSQAWNEPAGFEVRDWVFLIASRNWSSILAKLELQGANLQVHSKPTKFCHRPKMAPKFKIMYTLKTYSRHVVVVLEIQPVACVLPLKKGRANETNLELLNR